MNLPSIPTDNLYKFLAITGLILILVSLIYPEIEADKIQREIIQLETDASVIEVESEHLQLEQQMLITRYNTKSKNRSEHDKDEDLNKILEQNKKSMEFRMKAFEKIGNGRQIFRLNSRLGLIQTSAMYGVDVGAFLTLLGFILWYYKVQRHQDLIIKNESGAQSPTPSPPKEPITTGQQPKAGSDSGEVG